MTKRQQNENRSWCVCTLHACMLLTNFLPQSADIASCAFHWGGPASVYLLKTFDIDFWPTASSAEETASLSWLKLHTVRQLTQRTLVDFWSLLFRMIPGQSAYMPNETSKSLFFFSFCFAVAHIQGWITQHRRPTRWRHITHQTLVQQRMVLTCGARQRRGWALEIMTPKAPCRHSPRSRLRLIIRTRWEIPLTRRLVPMER